MRTAFSLCVILLLAIPVFGQNRGGTNTGGFNNGNTTFGQNTTGTGGTGFGGNSQTGTGGNQNNSGLGGQSGIGGGGFGSGFSFDPSFSASAFGGNSSANPTLSRAGMVGMGMGMGMGMSGFGMGGMGGMGMGMGSSGMGMQQQQQQTKVRPTVRLGFEVARPSAQIRAQQAQLTLARLPQAERFAGIELQMDGNRAIVSGQLKEPQDAELLRQLLLLEPGVYQVDLQQLNSANEPSVTDGLRDSSRIQPQPAESVPSSELVPPPG